MLQAGDADGSASCAGRSSLLLYTRGRQPRGEGPYNHVAWAKTAMDHHRQHHHHHHHRRLGPAGVRDTPWTGPGPRSFRKSDKQRLPRITYVILCGLGRALGPSAKATTATAKSDNSNSLTHSLTLSLTHSLCCCCAAAAVGS